MTIAEFPLLSPAFERARSLSRLLSTLFAIGFGLTLFFLATVAVLMWWPTPLMMDWDGVPVPLGLMAHGAALPMALDSVPGLFMLHHARKLFGCFAQGKVFAAEPTAHIRAVGVWLVVSAALHMVLVCAYALFSALFGHVGHPASFYSQGFEAVTQNIGTAVIGTGIIVAAYVMTEARRIADENASIL
ncbi:MAG: hypothetical protein JWN16_1963 [Alphaproteobacteria bacterium]|nr:hypothetical protein [Alphaproteobacteria bacterium]